MRHDHLKRELELMLLLTHNRQYKVDEICGRLAISRRNFYYYMEFFEQAGFKVEKSGKYYSLNRASRFFSRLYELIQLTDDEVVLMRQLIENSGMDSGRLKSLHRRLDCFFDFKILDNEALQRKSAAIRTILYDAIKSRRMVTIVGYSSPNSRSVKNRQVEPFMFLNNNKDVRCYEPSSGLNKTFRLSRMDGVEPFDRPWEYGQCHRQVYVDLFSFSDEKTIKVTLIMGQLSHNVMLEEYPESAACFVPREDGRWLFETDVCSYLGIGRFVLGLYDDMEILEDDGLRDYVKGKLQSWCNNLKK
jgi:predicted DNA-binding transcriptional regulator YafY